jgi:RHS repeat-associated protein
MARYAYDAADPRGQVQSVSFANGVTTNYTYKVDTGLLNTTKSLSGASSLIDVAYGYDAWGNVTTLTDSVNTNLSMSYTYDALNRLRTASRADLTNFAYDFNAAGNLINNNGTAQTFGSDNRLASSGTESFAWSADGTMTSRTNSANGTTVAYGWDNASRLKSVAVNGVEKERNYYDESGERFLKIYTQDPTTQVKSYYLGGVMEIREKWLSGVRDTSQTTRYIAGKDGQRLASVTDWDAGKNPLMALNSASYPGTQLALAGMTSVTGVSSFIKKLNHLYNGYMATEGFKGRIVTLAWVVALLLALLYIQLRYVMGIRIFGVAAEPTEFGRRHPVMASLLFPIVILFSGTFGCSNPNEGPGFLSALFTTQGSYPGSYYNGDGLLVGGPRALLSGDTTMGLPVGTYFYHSDHLGSSSVVTDATGAVTTRIHYLPYGQVDHPNSPGLDSVTYKFTGQEYDPEAGTDPNSGLYNYGARFFDPKLGIFISADTVHGGGLSQGMNRWMYVGGNPINYVDPSGHSWLSAMTNGLLWAVNNVGPTISGWTSGAVAGYDRAARGLSGTANWASAGIGGVYWGSQPYVDAIKGGYNEICDRLDDGDDDQNSHHSEAWNRENTLRLGGLRAMELGGWEGYLLQQASMAINVLLHVYHIPVSIALSYTYDDGYGAGVSYGPEEGSLSGGVHWQEKGAAAGWSVNVGFTYNFLDKDGKPAGGSMGLFASYHQKGLRSYGLSAGMQGKSGALGFRMVQSCMAGGTCSTAIQGFGMPNVATLIGKLNTLPEQVGDQNQLSGRRPTEVTFYKGGPHTTGLNGLTNGLGAFFAGETGPIMSFLDTFFTHPLSVIHDWMWTQGTPGWLFAIGNLPTFVPAYQIGNAIAASDYISTIGADCFTGGGSHCF